MQLSRLSCNLTRKFKQKKQQAFIIIIFSSKYFEIATMQQEKDYIDCLMERVARRVGKPEKDLYPFCAILRQNWYDTEQALESAKDQELNKLKIPHRVIAAIRQQIKLSNDLANKYLTEKNQEKPQNQSKNNKKSPLNQQKMLLMALKLQNQLVKQCNRDGPQVLRILNILLKIVHNIVQDSYEIKFRTLKKSNKTIFSTFYQHPSCFQFFKEIGFVEENQALYLHVPQTHQLCFIEECLRQLIGKLQNDKNSVKQQTKSITTPCVDLSQNFSNDEMERMNYAEGLEKLIAYREKLMSQIPKDRKLKIYHKKYDQKNVIVQKFDLASQIQKTDDQVIASYWKSFMNSNKKKSTFQSKRKLEFQFLLQQRIYKQTCIKIILPNQLVVQGWFSPMENLRKVFQWVCSIVIGEVYLYTTPPVKKMEKQLNLALDSLQCVPSGRFFLGANKEWYIANQYVQIIKK